MCVQRCVPRLTASELCALYDWEWLAAGGNPARCPWYFPGLLKVGFVGSGGWGGG